MGQYALLTEKQKKDFEKTYLPPGYTWEVCKDDVDPFKPTWSGEGFPVFISMFKEAGLRLPLDPLLCEYLRETKLSLGNCGLNVVRVVLSVAEMNRRFGLELGREEINYCYQLIYGDKDQGWYIRNRTKAPQLVKALPTSQKGKYDDIVIIKSGRVIDDTSRPLPKVGRRIGRHQVL